MTSDHTKTSISPESPSGQVISNSAAHILVSQNNHDLQLASQQPWADPLAGHREAIRLFTQFRETVLKLERHGWSAGRIQSE